MRTSMRIIFVVILMSWIGAARADQSWCNPQTGAYDHYPGPTSNYLLTSVTVGPWRGSSSDYPNNLEGFERYRNEEVVDCGSGTIRSYLNTTAGCLYGRTVVGSNITYKRGWIDGDVFRVVANGWSGTKRVMWRSQRVRYRAAVNTWIGTSNNQGLSIFARYRTEDDLYVASYKRDGLIFIKRKLCGIYKDLTTQVYARPLQPNRWYLLDFSVVTDSQTRLNRLILVVYPPAQLGAPIRLNGSDDATGSRVLASGTHGIRTDDVRAYVDDWQLSEP